MYADESMGPTSECHQRLHTFGLGPFCVAARWPLSNLGMGGNRDFDNICLRWVPVEGWQLSLALPRCTDPRRVYQAKVIRSE